MWSSVFYMLHFLGAVTITFSYLLQMGTSCNVPPYDTTSVMAGDMRTSDSDNVLFMMFGVFTTLGWLWSMAGNRLSYPTTMSTTMAIVGSFSSLVLVTYRMWTLTYFCTGSSLLLVLEVLRNLASLPFLKGLYRKQSHWTAYIVSIPPLVLHSEIVPLLQMTTPHHPQFHDDDDTVHHT